VAADLKLVGAVAIKVRPVATGFKKELQDKLREELKNTDIKAKIRVDLDTDQAVADAEKAKKEIEKKALKLKVGYDHASIRAAEKTLDQALKHLNDQTVVVHLDDQGSIDAAIEKLENMRDFSTVDMKFAADEKGYNEVLAKIAAIRREKIMQEIEFTTDEEGLREAEARIRQMMAESFVGVATVDVKYTNDRASIQKALDQINSELASIDAVEFEVTADKKSLKTTRGVLENALARTPVKLKVDYDDQDSLKGVRNKLNAMLGEIRAKELKFKFNEEAIRAELEKINGMIVEELETGAATVHISYLNNRASLAAAMSQVDAELDKIRSVHIDVELDENELDAKRAMLELILARTPIEIKVDYDDQDSLKAARQRLQEMLSELNAKNLEIEFNEEAIRAEIEKLNQMIHEEVKDRKVQIPVEPTGLEIVARQLQFASRARRVPFYVVVDAKSVAIAEGILRSLAGVNVLQSAGRSLENIITKFDTISVKIGAWGAAIAGLADILFYMTSSLFTVGEGMLQVVGLAALAPAAFSALATTVFIGASVFKDFGAAVHGIDAALKRLPPSGQKAALMIREVFKDLRENISEKFWSTASDSMLRFTETALPAFTRGLVKTSEKLGVVFGGILDSFTNLAAAGQLDTMFDNLTLMFENGAKGATNLWDALNILGLRGSEFLPRFGTWLADISTNFKDWIQLNDANGNINAWIEDGIIALKDMFFATGAFIDQLKAIARAAGLIGPNGLDDFRRTMEHIARVMGGEPWQSQMASIFSGAKEGAHELADGFKDFFGALKDSAFWTGQLLTLLGQLGGDTLSGFSGTISNLTFQQGSLDAIRGMSAMIRDMEPAFDRLGDLLGNLGSITGSVFRGLAPIVNSVMNALADFSGELSVNLQKIAPVLLNLTNNLVNFARGPLGFLVGVLNNFLTVLNGLPGPLRDATVAFGVFLLLRNQFGQFATAINDRWTKMTSSLVRDSASIVSSTSGNFTRMADGSLRQVVRMADGTDREMTRFGSFVNRGVTTANTAVGRFNAGHITSHLSTVAGSVSTIVGRINGSLALIGGIPGLVLGTLGVLIATIGGNAATASANVDRLRDSLDKVTGAATPETLQNIANSISNIDEAGDAWANFWRGVIRNADAGNETLEKLGINVGEAAKKISGSQKEYDDFLGTLEDIRKGQATGGFEQFIRTGQLPSPTKIQDFQTTQGIQGSRSQQGTRTLAPSDADIQALRDAKVAMDKYGISIENMPSGASLDVLTESIKVQRAQLEIARVKQQQYADVLGLTSSRAAEVSQITQTLGDKSIDASGKIDAINRSLDILNNKSSQQATEFFKMDQLEAGLENARAIKEEVVKSRDSLFKENGLLSEQSKAARNIYRILQEQADNVKVQAQTAYDIAISNGDNAAQASQKALQVINDGKGSIGQFASEMGLSLTDLDAQFATFFGSDWTLVATFTGRPDLFLAAVQAAKEAGAEFDGQTFIAWLLAQPDPAKLTVDDVIAYMQEHYDGITHKTTLDADPLPANKVIEDVISNARKFAEDQYQAVLRAYNSTEPGVREALMKIAEVTDPDWKARLLAALDQGSLSWVEFQLNQLARNRTMVIEVTTVDIARDESMANRMGGSNSARGSILNGLGLGMYGFNPKYFANGGIERHVAQITKAGGPIRVWAEKETQGEAYIPYASSKRPRSVSILAQVAKDFGYTLNKATQEFANGGVNGSTVTGPTTHTSADVHIGSLVTVDMNEAVHKLRQSQRDAMAVAGISTYGG